MERIGVVLIELVLQNDEHRRLSSVRWIREEILRIAGLLVWVLHDF